MVIVDASVIYKWFIDEEPMTLVNKARFLLEHFLLQKEDLLAPDILLYELGNAFATKKRIAENEMAQVWERFSRLKLPLYFPNVSFIHTAQLLAKKARVSVYDASYAILAEEKQATLFTADAIFVKQVHLPFVKHIGEYTA